MGLTQKLGTIPLAIQTDSSNNVGIGGAANASYKLAVTGAGLFSGALTASTTFTLDGTKKVFLRSNQSTGGGLLSGSAIGAMGNFSIYSDDGVAGDILGMYYWNGGTYRSALQFANVSSGSSNLLLMKDGGNVGIGLSNPTALLEILGAQDGVANKCLRLAYNGTYYGEYTEDSIRAYNNPLIFGTGTGGAERMRIRSNGNKTFNGPGGQDQMFSNSARTSNGDYIDINTESGGGNFQGFLIVANTYAYNGAYRTQGTYSVLGRDTTISATGLSVVNGPTGSSTYSITSPSTGVIRITNTGLYGDLIVSWRGFV